MPERLAALWGGLEATFRSYLLYRPICRALLKIHALVKVPAGCQFNASPDTRLGYLIHAADVSTAAMLRVVVVVM